MHESFDAAVIGLGGMGSAAFDQLAGRGLSVVGIDQFGVAHHRGSSHGESRIIRKAYFEHPDYVPLLLRAWDQWRELERDAGRSLLHVCGLMICGPPEGEAVAGARLARRMHNVPLEDVPESAAARRFPAFRIPAGLEVVFEPEAGFLEVEACVRAQLERGVRRGGSLRINEAVRAISLPGSHVIIETDQQTYAAGCAVFTPGAWGPQFPLTLNLPLEVIRKPVVWFPMAAGAGRPDLPTFYFERPQGAFYGVPALDGQTVKVGEHTGGTRVDDPDCVDRELLETDVGPLVQFIGCCLPQLAPRPVRHSVCLYTLTPDRNFIVDCHPDAPQVAVGAGFSGHGFKFAPVIGEALADLATSGRTRLPVDFLGRRRFVPGV